MHSRRWSSRQPQSPQQRCRHHRLQSPQQRLPPQSLRQSPHLQHRRYVHQQHQRRHLLPPQQRQPGKLLVRLHHRSLLQWRPYPRLHSRSLRQTLRRREPRPPAVSPLVRAPLRPHLSRRRRRRRRRRSLLQGWTLLKSTRLRLPSRPHSPRQQAPSSQPLTRRRHRHHSLQPHSSYHRPPSRFPSPPLLSHQHSPPPRPLNTQTARSRSHPNQPNLPSLRRRNLQRSQNQRRHKQPTLPSRSRRNRQMRPSHRRRERPSLPSSRRPSLLPSLLGMTVPSLQSRDSLAHDRPPRPQLPRHRARNRCRQQLRLRPTWRSRCARGSGRRSVWRRISCPPASGSWAQTWRPTRNCRRCGLPRRSSARQLPPPLRPPGCILLRPRLLRRWIPPCRRR